MSRSARIALSSILGSSTALALLSAAATAQRIVLPAGFETVEGSRSVTIPVANSPLRYMQLLSAADLTVPSLTIRGLALRPDGAVASVTNPVAVELEILLTTTTRDQATMTATFADNYGPPPTVVFQRKWVDLLPFTAQPGPRAPELFFWLDRGFDWVAAAGNLLIEVKVFGNTSQNRNVNWPVDGVWDGREGTIPARTTRVYSANGPDDLTGTLTRGYGLVWEIMPAPRAAAYRFRAGCAGSNGLPTANAGSLPALGIVFQVVLDRAPAAASAVLWLGNSRDQYRSLPLPFDLGANGAPGCAMLVAPTMFLPASASASGQATVAIPIPVDQSLDGARFFSQWFVADPGTNPLGLVTSNGLEGTIH